MRLRAAAEVVALDDAAEALAFRRADHVDDLALSEDARVDTRTQLEILEAVSRYFAQGIDVLALGQTGFLQMTFLGPVRAWPRAPGTVRAVLSGRRVVVVCPGRFTNRFLIVGE